MEIQYLAIGLQGARPATASIEVKDITRDPYQLIKAWRGLPRAIRLALKAAGLDPVSLARLAMTLARSGAPCTIRPGHRLAIALANERPAKRQAVKVEIVRHPEWAGLETVEEHVLHSP